jgi:hypothetical protein
VDIGHRVSTVCHLANIAIKIGREQRESQSEQLSVMAKQQNAGPSAPDPWHRRFDLGDEFHRVPNIFAMWARWNASLPVPYSLLLFLTA